jgi:hypothetical protein
MHVYSYQNGHREMIREAQEWHWPSDDVAPLLVQLRNRGPRQDRSRPLPDKKNESKLWNVLFAGSLSIVYPGSNYVPGR